MGFHDNETWWGRFLDKHFSWEKEEKQREARLFRRGFTAESPNYQDNYISLRDFLRKPFHRGKRRF